MNDTTPEIAAMVHARLMAKTGEERFLMGIRMHEAARRMVMASFPPGISDEQRKRLLFERFYGGEMGISEEEALEKGMEEKSKEFAEAGPEVCVPA
jgi:hypothetical protein